MKKDTREPGAAGDHASAPRQVDEPPQGGGPGPSASREAGGPTARSPATTSTPAPKAPEKPATRPPRRREPTRAAGRRRLLDDIRSAWRGHGRSLREPGFWAVSTYALGQAAARAHALPLRAMGSATYGALSLGLRWCLGIELNREASIGRDLHLVHGWNVKVHPETVIGDRVGLMHDVTLGTTPDRPRPPTIGSDVFIGAGARVLGDVVIGDGARIAANSLVLTDVPPGATAIGVPARVLRYSGRDGSERRESGRRWRRVAVAVERRVAIVDRRRNGHAGEA
jgi:serine O-acetyltransferase